MNVTINVFDPSELQRATEDLLAYFEDLENKANRICERLAEIGKTTATQGFADAEYDGDKDVAVSVEPIQNGYAVHARGNSVLFIEFGSGALYGYGHPEPELYGPGTWSDGPGGKGHWQDPNGWYYKHNSKSYGNAPAQAMYDAKTEVERRAEEVANEVFNE